MKKTSLYFAVFFALIISFGYCFGFNAVAAPEDGIIVSDSPVDVDNGAGEVASPAPEVVAGNDLRTINIDKLPCKDQPFYYFEVAKFNVTFKGSRETLHAYVEKNNGKYSLFLADENGIRIIPAEGNNPTANIRIYSKIKSKKIDDSAFTVEFSETELAVDNISIIANVDKISNILFYDNPDYTNATEKTTVAKNEEKTTNESIQTDSSENSIAFVKEKVNIKTIIIAAVVTLTVIIALVLTALLLKNKKEKIDTPKIYFKQKDIGNRSTANHKDINPPAQVSKTIKTGIPVGVNEPISFNFNGIERKNKQNENVDSNAPIKPLPPQISTGQSAPSDASAHVPSVKGKASVDSVSGAKSALHDRIMACYRGVAPWDFHNNGRIVSCSNEYNIGLGETPAFKPKSNIKTGYAVFDNKYLYLYSSVYVGEKFKLFSEFRNVGTFFDLIKEGKPDTVRSQDIADIIPAVVRFENDSFVLEKKGVIYTK